MKTAARTRNHRATNRKHVENYVHGVIRRAMIQTAVPRLGRRLKSFISHSVHNVKAKTNNIHKGVSRYAYKNPYKSLTIAALTGAIIGAVIAKNATTTRAGLFDRFRR